MSTQRLPIGDHDHQACIASAMKDADAYCGAHGLRLTPVRRRVLELIWKSHCPSGAYSLLERLTRDGHKPSPPTVYRALDFLLEHGLIHRVSSLNAFLGCNHPGDEHAAQIFICEHCGVAVEQADTSVNRRLSQAAAEMHFRIRRQTVEITGLCAHCMAAPGHD